MLDVSVVPIRHMTWKRGRNNIIDISICLDAQDRKLYLFNKKNIIYFFYHNQENAIIFKNKRLILLNLYMYNMKLNHQNIYRL